MTILHGVIGLSHGDGTTQILPSTSGTVIFTRVHRSVAGETVRMPESVAVEYTGGVLPETQLAAGAWRVEVAPCDARADDWTIDVPESGPVALASLVPVAEVDGVTYTRGEPGRGIESISDPDDQGDVIVTWTDGTTTSMHLPTVTWGPGEREAVEAAVLAADRADAEADRAAAEHLALTAAIAAGDYKGEKGDQGERGEQGERGLTGAQGERGERGLTGDKGDKGDRGDKGDQGPQGLPGVKGDKGDTGAKGSDAPLPVLSAAALPAGAAPTVSGTYPNLALGIPAGAKGDPGAPGAVPTAASYLIVGLGRPDTPSTTGGLVTGSEPVGCEYRSTDGAGVGAYVWRKRPGGTWIVVEGDTGWRDVSALIPQRSGGTLRIKRVAGSVLISADDIEFPKGATDVRLIPDAASAFFWDGGGGTYPGALYDLYRTTTRVDGVNLTVPDTANAAVRLRDARSYPCTRPWPTTLPGSPA